MAGADFGNLPEDATIILDNEPRSREIIKRMENLIENNYELVIWPDSIPHKDINDMILAGMTSVDVQKLIKQNTYNGLQATARLSAWKRI